MLPNRAIGHTETSAAELPILPRVSPVVVNGLELSLSVMKNCGVKEEEQKERLQAKLKKIALDFAKWWVHVFEVGTSPDNSLLPIDYSSTVSSHCLRQFSLSQSPRTPRMINLLMSITRDQPYGQSYLLRIYLSLPNYQIFYQPF